MRRRGAGITSRRRGPVTRKIVTKRGPRDHRRQFNVPSRLQHQHQHYHVVASEENLCVARNPSDVLKRNVEAGENIDFEIPQR